MSPLVALLALACAAPLAVQAQDCKGPNTQIGRKTMYQILLPPVFIAANLDNVKADLPDECAPKGCTLVGVSIVVCGLTPSDVTIPPKFPFSPMTIHRKSQLHSTGQIVVIEYCDYL